MNTPLHALLVGDSATDAELLLSALRRDGFEPVAECVRTAEAMRAVLLTKFWDVVLCDDAVPGINPDEAWRVLRQSGLDLPFIIISDTGGEDLAVAALKRGASDYLLKDRLARLGQAIRHSMEEARLRQENARTMAALRRSEEIHRNLIETMSEGVTVQDRHGCITFMNGRACEMLGYSMGELVGKPVTFLFDEENQAILREQMTRRLKGAREDYEIAWLKKDGGRVNTIVTPRPRFDAQGALVESVAVITDITGRKLAEEQLKLRSAALEAAGNAVFITDRTGTILWANPAFAALNGFPLAEVIGRKPNLVKSGAHDARFYADLWATLLTGRVWQGQITNRSKDGRLYIAEQTIAPVKDDSGATTHFVAVQQDITARQRAENQLREQAALLDKAHDAIIVRDLDHRIRYWNKSAEQIYGWTAAEALGRRVAELIYFDVAEFEKAAAAVLQHGGWAGELRQVRKDGGEIIVDSSWTLVRDPEGRPSSFMSINTDITEKKKLAAQFHRIQRLDSIGTLAGGIAHDLNNILAPMLMALELLRLKHDDAETLRWLAMLETNAQRGAQMLRQMLAFGRGGGEGVRVAVSPVPIVREVARIVHDTFPKSIRCGAETNREIWPVTGDPTELHQVLLNLCLNARDAMPEGGTLSIQLENMVLDETYAGLNPESRPGPYVLLSVTDTGTGIPPGLREKIFEPFFTTKAMGKGTGLGLSTVRALVKGHGGFINLYSEPGKGSTFKVYLPASARPGAAEDVAIAHTGLPRGNGELVLLADDEEAVREIARKTLERFGYRVLLAANGAEAVSLYAQHREKIAVVVTDMAMPVMDGAATIIALRTIGPGVKIIGSSGMGAGSHSATAKAAGLGFECFIPKPYTADVMLNTLHQILAGEAPPPPHGPP